MKRNIPFAVIEFGSTAIRLAIAENQGRGELRIIENLQQAVLVGRDSFHTDFISEETTTECIKAVRNFFETLKEYGILKKNITVVATTAIKTASNREQFMDRIYISTGLLINILDDADICRFSYRAVKPVLEKEVFFKKENTITLEVGGGSTDCVYFENGRVTSSHVYEQGSYRVNSKAKATEKYGSEEYQEVVQNLIGPTINKIKSIVDLTHKANLVALGSEMRFVAHLLNPKQTNTSIVKVTTSEFISVVKELAKNSVDKIAKKYSLSYENAESLLPTLMIYLELINTFKMKYFFVLEGSLRSGILQEVISTKSWTNEFKRQVYNSAMVLSKKYGVNSRFVSTVSKYSYSMLAFLSKHFEFFEEDEILLNMAAILHGTGQFISMTQDHKHAMYIIENSDLFGISSKNKTLIALIARYYCGALPSSMHEEFVLLDRINKIRVSKLAAILRIIRVMSLLTNSYQKHSYKIKEDVFQIIFEKSLDIAMIQSKLINASSLFSNIYGLKVTIIAKN